MSDDPRHTFGEWGEGMAVRRLEAAGFEIEARGFRCRFGEIDIIARKADLLVFCEVKSRRRSDFATPFEAVGRTKQQRLIKTAGWYLSRRDWDGEVRFDVIAVLARPGKRPEVEWIEDAFSWW